MSDKFEFVEWPSIRRLWRDAIITEKIDGTNAAVLIFPRPDNYSDLDAVPYGVLDVVEHDGVTYWVGAQSRNRLLTVKKDNMGFAAYVVENSIAFVKTLGPGRHFGEWWGLGIQRGYGLTEKRFSLFNVSRWNPAQLAGVPQLSVVPTLAITTFSTTVAKAILSDLEHAGSVAAPGWMKPEGIVIYHTAAGTLYKATVENDHEPKSVSTRRLAALQAGIGVPDYRGLVA